YARSLGMRIVRIVAVSDTGSSYAPPPPPMPVMMEARVAGAPMTKIEPGEQKLQVSVAMTFELQ
ncbi:MAG TPA: SIMPL domain-containing protein, partial [Sphingomicrobium sp.]